MAKNKKIAIVLGILVCVLLVVGVIFYALNFKKEQDTVVITGDTMEVPNLDSKNMTYIIEGETFVLKDGVAEKEGEPGTLSKNMLTMFNEPVYGDFDRDGDVDAAVWLLNDSGGTGKFHYAVLNINTGSSYRPTNAMFLGDRISPQFINIQEGRVVYNFKERRPNDPMTAEPTIEKSIWIHYNQNTGEIGEFVKDFEGEADIHKMNLFMKTWNWVSATYPEGNKIYPEKANAFTISFKKDGTFSASTDCNGIGGNYIVKNKAITFSDMLGTLMYCEGSQEDKFREIFEKTDNYYFTSKGELIFGFKGGSGIAIFR